MYSGVRMLEFKTSPVIGEGTWIQTGLYILLMLMTVSILKDIRTSRKLSRRLEDGINFDVREGIFLGFSKGTDGERILNMDCDGEECRVVMHLLGAVVSKGKEAGDRTSDIYYPVFERKLRYCEKMKGEHK